MGGYGSSRWGWRRTRTDTDGLLKLDVRWLARQGYLAPGTSGVYPVAWSQGDRPAGDITIHYDADRPDELVLDYRERRHESESWSPVREAVPLDSTPCPYGGERPWFRCPGCLSRRAVLYGAGARFRCRACHGLAYGSTREGAAERNRRRTGELRRRIGGEPGIFSAPWKPKGMHWRTYDRIVAEINAREYASLVAFGAETDAMMARFERKYGPLAPG